MYSQSLLRWLLLLLLLGIASGCQRLATTDDPPPVYVALGASDSVGVGANDMARDAWPTLVHAQLPPETQLLNLAISGATLDEVLRSELPPAIDAQPRWVSIWPGVNDLRTNVSLSTFSRQLDAILSSFDNPESGAKPTLIVLNIPDMRHLPALRGIDPVRLDQTVRLWNQSIAEIAARHDAVLVDLYGYGQELADHPGYISADGFHPSTAGYQRIAELVLATLEPNVSTQP